MAEDGLGLTEQDVIARPRRKLILVWRCDGARHGARSGFSDDVAQDFSRAPMPRQGGIDSRDRPSRCAR